MHPLFTQASGITHDVNGAAIEVHKDKGPGLLESIYEWCLTMELNLPSHQMQNQETVVIRYKQFSREEPDAPLSLLSPVQNGLTLTFERRKLFSARSLVGQRHFIGS